MKILSANHSSLPRIGEDNKDQRLRKAYSDLERSKIDMGQFRQIENETIDELVSIQREQEIDILTDGLVRWYDPVSHLARNLSGFEINGLLRYFDTNFYYRQPIAGNIISTSQGQLADEIRYLKKLHNQSAKAVLLGPYSFAKMTLNSTGLEFGEYALKIAGILNKEIINFVKAGADYIQIDEPCFVREPGDYEFFSSLIAAACENISGSVTILSFYFGDCGKIMNRLNEIPVDMIGFDFTYSPNLLERLSSDGFSKPLAFGVIDGRNTRLESADAIAKILEKPLSKMNFDSCLITSSCGLEFLPRQYAIKKLRAISKTAKLLNG